MRAVTRTPCGISVRHRARRAAIAGVYRAGVTRSRFEEFEVHFPDGSVVTRLPVGLAADRWWLAFVTTNLPEGMADGEFDWLTDDMRGHGRFRVTGIGGHLSLVNGGGGGDGKIVDVRMEYELTGITGIRVEYMHNGAVVADEDVDLS